MRGKASRSGPGGEIGKAAPVADAARRFRGSANRLAAATVAASRLARRWAREPRPYGQLGGWYGGPMWASAPTESYHGVRRGGALPRPRATARVAPTEGCKRCGEVRYHPGTASPCQPSLGKGPRGRGKRIATTSLRTGLAMTPFTRGAVQHRRADRGVRSYKNADDLARAGGVEPRPYAAHGV